MNPRDNLLVPFMLSSLLLILFPPNLCFSCSGLPYFFEKIGTVRYAVLTDFAELAFDNRF